MFPAAAQGTQPATELDLEPRKPSIERPTVIYIVGRGHSGSTLLDLLISSHQDVVSVGEAKQFQTRPDNRCTCDAPHFWDCPFWSSVDAELRREGLRLGTKSIGEGEPEEVARYNEAFFRAVAVASGKSVIVDSSKSRTRLEYLLAADIDLRVIHLVRSAPGVVYSNLKRGRVLTAECRKLASETVRTRLVLSGRPHLFVRYEDLAREPRGELERIMGALGLTFDPAQLETFKAGERHNFGGNGMRRRSDDQEIRLDEHWREALTSRQKLSILMRTLPARVTNQKLLLWLDRR